MKYESRSQILDAEHDSVKGLQERDCFGGRTKNENKKVKRTIEMTRKMKHTSLFLIPFRPWLKTRHKLYHFKKNHLMGCCYSF